MLMSIKYILYILLLSNTIYAQKYEVMVTQDLSHIVFDDNFGNEAPTLDLLIKARMFHQNFHVTMIYERAELMQPFNRIAVGIGAHYTYRRIGISSDASLGMIVRPFSNTMSLGSDTEIYFILWNNFKIVAIMQITQRTEWGKLVRISGFGGIAYMIR